MAVIWQPGRGGLSDFPGLRVPGAPSNFNLPEFKHPRAKFSPAEFVS